MSAAALFLVPVLIWGSTWYAITLQFGAVEPEVSVVYRFAAASALLALGCAMTGRSLRFSLRDHAFLAGIGLTMICLNYNLIYWAERIVVSGLVAVVYSTIVFMTPIGMRIAFGVPMQPRLLAAAALGVTGVALLFLPELREAGRGGNTAFGIALVLAAALACALGNLIAVRNHRAGIPTIPGTAWTMIYGTMFAVAVALASGAAWTFDARPAYAALARLSRGVRQRRGVRRVFRAAEARRGRAVVLHRRRDSRHRADAVDAARRLPVDAGRRGGRGAGRGRQRAGAALRGQDRTRSLVFAILS